MSWYLTSKQIFEEAKPNSANEGTEFLQEEFWNIGWLLWGSELTCADMGQKGAPNCTYSSRSQAAKTPFWGTSISLLVFVIKKGSASQKSVSNIERVRLACRCYVAQLCPFVSYKFSFFFLYWQGSSAIPEIVNLKEAAIPGTVVWLSRSARTVTEKNCENEVNMGQIVGSAVDSFNALFNELYIPLLNAQDGWGQAPKSLVQSFLQVCYLFSSDYELMNSILPCGCWYREATWMAKGALGSKRKLGEIIRLQKINNIALFSEAVE